MSGRKRKWGEGGRGRAGLDGKGWHGAGIQHSVAGSGERATSLHATVPDAPTDTHKVYLNHGTMQYDIYIIFSHINTITGTLRHYQNNIMGDKLLLNFGAKFQR